MADKTMLRLLELDPRKHRSIAVTGGGGKTTLIFRLTRELLALGERVIITTTTHMAYEPDKPFALHGEPSSIEEHLNKEGMVIAGEFSSCPGKICSLEPEALECLTTYGAVLLIEADGAKCLPVKVPEAWEPVIPSFSDLVIGVAGLDCIEKAISITAHRADKMTSFLKKDKTQPVTWEDIYKLSLSEEGLRKGVQGRDFRVYFNKADVLQDTSKVEELVRRIRKAGIQASYGSLKEKEQ